MKFQKRILRIVAILIIAMTFPFLGGCGKGGRRVEVREFGLSIKLPAGWGQGEPRASGGYIRSTRGAFFFENAENDDPSGDVMQFPLEGKTLAEFVDAQVKMTDMLSAGMQVAGKILEKATSGAHSEEFQEAQETLKSKVISKIDRTISGLPAIEVVTEAQFSLVEVYVAKGDNAIVVTFRAPKEDFPKYETLFRKSIDSIKIR